MSLTLKFHAWMQECIIIAVVINQDGGTTRRTNMKKRNKQKMYVFKKIF